MSYAKIMRRLITEVLDDTDDTGTSVFQLRGAGGGLYGTPSTRDLESVFNAKGYINGKHYMFHGPFMLRVRNKHIDKDIVDLLRLQGAVQVA